MSAATTYVEVPLADGATAKVAAFTGGHIILSVRSAYSVFGADLHLTSDQAAALVAALTKAGGR